MELGDWETSKDVNGIYAEIRRLGLERCIAEHDAFGFTVVPAEEVAPPEFHQRLRQALLVVHERRTGEHIDIADIGRATISGAKPRNDTGNALVGEDPVFAEALLNPVVLALARYFLGKSVQLSDMVSLVKRTDPMPTHMLHTDQHGTPPPLPQYAQTLNITWTLTDYSLEEGSAALVPGSHRWGHPPTAYEANHLAPDAKVKAVPINCKAGSLVIWGGTTWHGSFPRTAPGLRMTLILVFTRNYMNPLQDWAAQVPAEVFDRNPPEFADLLGKNLPWPRKDGRKRDQGPDKVGAFIAAGSNPWG